MTADARRWRDVGDNPDDAAVIAWREVRVRSAAKPPLATYAEVVRKYCSGNRVLDFGAANHGAATTNVGGTSTHDIVATCAANVVAVDIVPFHQAPHDNCTYVVANLLGGEAWNAAGIDPVDVLFAGHVIEHLDTPGQLFDLAELSLRAGGLLAVVTPNPLWFPSLYSRATYKNASINPDHVALFGAGELAELAERHGFRLVQWRYAGRGDMVSAFRMYAGFRWRVIDAAYRLARARNWAFAHNHLVAIFERET